MVETLAWIALVLLAGAVSLLVIAAIRKPMNEVLKANSYISPARRFYLRSFCLIILLATLGTIVSTDGPCEEQAGHLMPGIWWVLRSLNPVLWSGILSIGGYALLLTILFAVLGRYRDE